MRRSKLRVKLRGSIGEPRLVVNTSPVCTQPSPALSRVWGEPGSQGRLSKSRLPRALANIQFPSTANHKRVQAAH
jgi:hypothetical protein